MTRDHVISTPIFDQLLREMAQRADPHPQPPAAPEPEPAAVAEQARTATRRRHRAE